VTPKALEAFLLSLPAATLSIQWGSDHVFKIGGKMFAAMAAPTEKFQGLSFKVGEDSFAILTKQKGIIPAPYLARAHWVQLQSAKAMSDRELKAYLTRAHAIVAAGLSKKKRVELGISA
jgi:predicted DNA-binding protein (MmcQ/YjbR family)